MIRSFEPSSWHHVLEELRGSLGVGSGSGFMVQGLGFMGVGFMVWGLLFRVQGLIGGGGLGSSDGPFST